MHKIVRYAVIAAVILLGLIAVVAAQNSSFDMSATPADGLSTAGNEAPTIVGGDENTLRELLARVVHPIDGEQPIVYVGGLPEELPFDLLLADKSHVIGSIVYSDRGDMQIFLDVPLKAADLIDFYHHTLDGVLWKVVENYPYPGYKSGFVADVYASVKFCYNDGKATLTVNAQSRETLSNVQIDISFPGNAATCSWQDFLDLPGSLLPQLKTPDGVELLPGNGHGSGGGGLSGYRMASMSANLSSKLSLQDIAKAYIEQLQNIGWQKSDSESGNHIAWTGWTLKDSDGKNWAGTFLLTANPGVEDQYMAQVTVQEIPLDTK